MHFMGYQCLSVKSVSSVFYFELFCGVFRFRQLQFCGQIPVGEREWFSFGVERQEQQNMVGISGKTASEIKNIDVSFTGKQR